MTRSSDTRWRTSATKRKSAALTVKQLSAERRCAKAPSLPCGGAAAGGARHLSRRLLCRCGAFAYGPGGTKCDAPDCREVMCGKHAQHVGRKDFCKTHRRAGAR